MGIEDLWLSCRLVIWSSLIGALVGGLLTSLMMRWGIIWYFHRVKKAIKCVHANQKTLAKAVSALSTQTDKVSGYYDLLDKRLTNIEDGHGKMLASLKQMEEFSSKWQEWWGTEEGLWKPEGT